jgi:hypothetical protein
MFIVVRLVIFDCCRCCAQIIFDSYKGNQHFVCFLSLKMLIQHQGRDILRSGQKNLLPKIKSKVLIAKMLRIAEVLFLKFFIYVRV